MLADEEINVVVMASNTVIERNATEDEIIKMIKRSLQNKRPNRVKNQRAKKQRARAASKNSTSTLLDKDLEEESDGDDDRAKKPAARAASKKNSNKNFMARSEESDEDYFESQED
mmetsp:Transcript_18049/g.27157  ORF Transcript_18049/g.27157 Transcript_18049/m.27157 type:complete len:115 (-) Transcript_18049:90-434(-)